MMKIFALIAIAIGLVIELTSLAFARKHDYVFAYRWAYGGFAMVIIGCVMFLLSKTFGW